MPQGPGVNRDRPNGFVITTALDRSAKKAILSERQRFLLLSPSRQDRCKAPALFPHNAGANFFQTAYAAASCASAASMLSAASFSTQAMNAFTAGEDDFEGGWTR